MVAIGTIDRDNGVMGESPGASFRAYAHRGGAREATENSLTAFRQAAGLGFTYLETDVRPTRDGVAVLHHDADLGRTTDGTGKVRNHTWQQIRSVRLADGSAPDVSFTASAALVDKAGHSHFMAKEIAEQPVVIADALKQYIAP